MTPALAKLNFAAHVTTSVAWCGAVASFLVLSVAGLSSHDPQTVRAAYLAMNLIGQFLIVPLSLAALLTGLVQSLGTRWGLVRYYWVVMKLALTIGATCLLLLHQFTAVSEAARRVLHAAAGTLPDVRALGQQLVGDAGLALLALLAMSVLGIYKPWGLTRYGRRKQREESAGRLAKSTALAQLDGALSEDRIPIGVQIFAAVAGLLVVGFALLHHAGNGLGSHGH